MITHPYHFHVDGIEVSPEFERFLLDEGCFKFRFENNPAGIPRYAPLVPFTCKFTQKTDFKQFWERAEERSKMAGAFDGYIEGEFLSEDRPLEAKPFDASVPIPFRATQRRLAPGTFRDCEIHVAYDYRRSAPRLTEALLEMGFFFALLRKPSGVTTVLTIQGDKHQISELVAPTAEYLSTAGGAVDGSFKVERIVAWSLSRKDVPLPPVIDSIGWAR